MARAESYPELVQHDNIVMRYLFGSSQHALNKHKPVGESSACGIGALKWMKEWLQIKMFRASLDNIPLPKYPRLTMYYHSYSVSPDSPITDISQILIQDRKLFKPDVSTVGYMGVLITNQPYIDLELPRSMAYYLTDFERLYLRDMARFSVMTQLYYDMSLDELSGYLLWHPVWSIIKRGVFVTIYKTNKTPDSKELRGCIGMIDATKNTVINYVIKYARESAFQDSRFSPITKDEFQQADQSSSFMYEISVLAPKAPITIPEYLEDPDKFKLGNDGILLVQGPNQGFFLPSVATEFKMTKAKQLGELCRKAGIRDVLCYKKPGAKLYYMEGFGFGF
jgi:AmmeMemoRadiSam system protein A